MDDETRQVVKRIAGLVTEAREERGLSDAELAARSGVARAEIERLMRAEVDPQLDTIFRLAGALRVDPSDLLRGIEWLPDGTSGGRFRLDAKGPG